MSVSTIDTFNSTVGALTQGIGKVRRRRGAFRSLVLLGLCVLVALIGQVYLIRRQYPLDGAIFYVVAILLFIRATRGLPDAVASAAVSPSAYSLIRSLPAALLGLAAIVAFVQNRSNTGLLLTIIAGLALVIAYWREGVTSSGRIRLERWETVSLLGILLLGFFLRVYRLDAFPATLYLDEGDFGSLALKLIRTPTYTPFVTEYTGHPTLWFYGLGLYLKLAGIGIASTRLYTIAMGMLSIVFTFFLARELMGGRGALVAAFVMAISTWAINFSRIVFTGAAVPLAAAITMYFLVRGLRTHQPLDFVWSGLALGLGMSTYLAFRVIPVLVVLYLLYKVIGNRAFVAVYTRGVVVLALAAIISFAPLGIYYLKHPSDFLSRAQAASVFLDIQREKSHAPLWANIRKAFGMFNYQGDPRPRHNLPHNPMVDPFTGILLVLGFGYTLWHWRKAENSMLISWLVLGMLPGVFSLADSNPHSLRTIANLPVVCILAAVSAERIATFVRVNYDRQAQQRLLTVAAVVGVAALAVNMHVYFDKQAKDRSVYYDFDPVQNEVALEVVRQGKTRRMIVANAFTNHSAVKFLADGIPYETFNQAGYLPLRDIGDRDITFILEPAQRQLVTVFQTYYPTAEISNWLDKYGNHGYIKINLTRDQAAQAQGVTARYYRGSSMTGNPDIQQVESSIAADWTTNTPVEPPFVAAWNAALYVPRYGPYSLTLISNHPATVTLDHMVVLTTTGGQQAISLNLFGGFHDLKAETTVQDKTGGLSLRWKPPDGSEQTIPRSSLFTLDLAANGLLGKYYRGNAWAGAPALQQKDLFIFPNDLLPAPFSIEWEGKIYAPQDGQYVFGTSSDDGSQLFIDNKLVVDNGGHHSERYVEGRITLSEGLHDLRLRYFQDDGGRVMDLYWVRPGGTKELVPTAVLFPPGAVISGPVVIAPPVAIPTPVAPTTPGQPVPTGVARVGAMGPVLTIGREGSGQGEFRNPKGVAVDRDGNIYVADTGNKRIQKFDRQGKFVTEWKGGREPFTDPIGIAIAPNGDIYVLEAERDGAHYFSSRGEYRGKVGDGLGLYRPRGLNIDAAGVLYFANTGGNNVVRASASGQPLGAIGSAGKRDGQLEQPTDVFVDRSGTIFVADTYNQRIQRFTADGRYVTKWAIPASGTASGPHIAVGSDGVVYVTDPDNGQIAAYSPDGAILATWGGQGGGDGQFNQPVGIFMDANGLLYIADSGNHRIQVWGKR